MEEVDNIIIHSLRQIGCDIHESITSLATFNTELIVKATVRCLELIYPDLDLNPTLPTNVAARFRMGATLAQFCSELGYRGDIGYQTFLYSVEADLRRVFMFLLEKLPREIDKSVIEPLTKNAQLEKLIASAIQAQISVPWLPYYCHKKRFKFNTRTKTPFTTVQLDSSVISDCSEYQNYAVRHKRSLIQQVPNFTYFVPSVISLNSRLAHALPYSISKKVDWLTSQKYNKIIETSENDSYVLGRLISNIKLIDLKSPVNDNSKIDTMEIGIQESAQLTYNNEIIKEQEIEKIKNECEGLKVAIEEIQIEIKKLTSDINQTIATQEIEAKELAAYEEQSKIERKAYELLDNSKENIKKLNEAIEASTNKLINLANQWEKHRLPLIEHYRDEKEKYFSKASANQKQLDELRMIEDKEQELLEECRNKDQQYSRLVADVQKLPKEVNRSAYTQRILEIINNVKKQKDEIDKVLKDTREIQKEINTLTGRLERSFTVADELIFQDARSNETSRKAYKLLAKLHSDCSELVNLVEETGATVREIRDLEEQIELESSKNIGANLERITADLKQMRQETETLTAQLQNKIS